MKRPLVIGHCFGFSSESPPDAVTGPHLYCEKRKEILVIPVRSGFTVNPSSPNSVGAVHSPDLGNAGVAVGGGGVDVDVGGTSVGVAVGGTGVEVDVGGIAVGVEVGSGVSVGKAAGVGANGTGVGVGSTGVGVAAGAPHPARSSTTNVRVPTCRSSFWQIIASSSFCAQTTAHNSYERQYQPVCKALFPKIGGRVARPKQLELMRGGLWCETHHES